MPKLLKQNLAKLRNLQHKYFYLLAGLAVLTVLGLLLQPSNSGSVTKPVNNIANPVSTANATPQTQPQLQVQAQANLSNIDTDSLAYKELEAKLKIKNASDKSLGTTVAGSQPTNTAQNQPTSQILGNSTTDSGTGSSSNSTGQEFTNSYLNSVIVGITSFIVPVGQSNGTAAAYDPKKKTAIEGLVNLTGELYANKPVSAEIWALDLQQRVSQTAYAQENNPTYNPGSGYNLLSPVRDLWRTTSNIVYLFYIVIIIGIAFLIVFRQQLDGQNAVNLFNAIPSIIISLVLVFFSYPLSALFIDFITIGSGVTYGVLIGSPGSSAPGAFLHEDNVVFNPGDVNVIPNFQRTSYTAQNGLQIDDRYVSIWQIFFSAGVNPDAQGINKIIPQEAPFSEILRNIIGSIEGLGGGILLLVFSFAAFTAQLNLFFKLAREYVVLTFYVVLSPFFFLFAAIPGQTGNFIGQYFRKLLTASVSFIAVYALFLIIIIVGRSTGGAGDPVWLPPLLGYNTGGLPTGETVNNIIRPLLAFFLFLSAPLIPDAVENLLAEGQNDVNPGANFGKYLQQGANSLISTTIAPLDRTVKGSLDINPRTRG